jgi:hypothetical protein
MINERQWQWTLPDLPAPPGPLEAQTSEKQQQHSTRPRQAQAAAALWCLAFQGSEAALRARRPCQLGRGSWAAQIQQEPLGTVAVSRLAIRDAQQLEEVLL